jgi:hypothetical protein
MFEDIANGDEQQMDDNLNHNHNPEAADQGTDEEPLRSRFEEFLFHQRRALEETGKAIEALFPERFVEHGKKAGTEFNTAMRALVDAVTDEIKKAAETARTAKEEGAEDDDDDVSTTGKTKVRVQVE